jgi:hypothetical protein
MQQKTINLRNQGSFDKKIDFFPQTLSHIPRWVRLEQKTRAKNSHAWAPLNSGSCELIHTEPAAVEFEVVSPCKGRKEVIHPHCIMVNNLRTCD